MGYSNKATVNFAGGEVSPGLVARTDIPLFNKVLARMENFIAETQGPARYRQGTRYVHHTRNNNPATFIEFQFSDVQSYLIEVTAGYLRFYKDEGIIFKDTSQLTITGISKANPGVVTYTGTDPTNGQEVYISGVVGMTEVNGNFYTVAGVNSGANTFQLTDVFGNNVDTSGFTTYTSGGIAQVVYEVTTPFFEDDLTLIDYDQNADTMYIVTGVWDIRKLTRSAHDSWSFGRYSRTTDPFSTANTLTGVTQANPAVVTYSGTDRFANGDTIYIDSIVGMTELNGNHYKVASVNTGANTFALQTLAGANVNSTGYGAYSSGGFAEKYEDTGYPKAVGFTDDARLMFGGTAANPETLYGSRSPSTAGVVRFDDFTTGTDATNAVIFTLAPLQGKVDSIRWITNTDKYIAVGTFGSVRRVFGATEAASITPDEITAKGANSDGVFSVRPIVDGSVVFYISRSGLALETIEYDYQVDGYSPDDKNLVSNHLTIGGIKQIARQIGRPTIIWAVRNDGIALGLTFKAKENIAGWHRHKLGGTSAQVERIGIMPRANNQDQLWFIVKREINGNTVRYVEFLTDVPTFPSELDFYTGQGNQANDYERYVNYQSEIAKHAIHLDCSLTYDGSAYGTDASASITMGEGAEERDTTGVVVTASAAVFTASMVGRQIWGAYTSEGIGGGRLRITGFTSSTVITGTVLDQFPATATYDAGDWFITATSVSGLDHLEGQTVGLITDGAVPSDVTVDGGVVTFTQPASVVHVGLRYRGVMQTLPLDQGGSSGPAQNKLKSIATVAVRFINAAGCSFGASLYNLVNITFRRGNDFTDRPVPLFNGSEEAFCEDGYDINKTLTIIQENPLPCTVASLDIFMDTSEE